MKRFSSVASFSKIYIFSLSVAKVAVNPMQLHATNSNLPSILNNTVTLSEQSIQQFTARASGIWIIESTVPEAINQVVLAAPHSLRLNANA